MTVSRLILIDRDDARRTDAYRILRPHIDVVPVGDPAELGRSWPDDVWYLVHDDDDLCEAVFDALERGASFRPIVLFAETFDPGRMAIQLFRGAMTYLPWPSEPQLLLRAIAQVATLAERRRAAWLARAAARTKVARLSPREYEVMTAMRQGLTNKEIGRELAISNRTVEIHRANAIAKLEAGQSTAAAALLVEAEQDLVLRPTG